MPTGVLWVICVLFGHGGCMRTPLLAWKYPYNQRCRALQSLFRPASAHSGYIYQAKTWLCDIWPVRARKTTNWPSMCTESLVAHVWKLYVPPLAAGYTAQFKIHRNIVRTLNARCAISHSCTGLALTGPVDCPRASCDLGIKYLMLRSHAGDPWVCPGS